MIIGTDIDNTVINTGKIWARWLQVMFGKKVLPKKNIDYNLDNYYAQEHDETGHTLTKEWFFDQKDLYSKKRKYFVNSAEEVCRRLKIRGHSVVGISHCTAGNIVSKLVMTRGAFLMDKLYNRYDKSEVDVDVFIDDRNIHLNQFINKPDVILIKMETPYAQDEELLPEIKKRVVKVGGLRPWDSIYRVILKEEKRRGGYGVNDDRCNPN